LFDIADKKPPYGFDKGFWKPVVGFAGYLVGINGVVWSLKRGRALTQYRRQRGADYLSVNLSVGSVLIHKQVHRLVAEAFLPNPKHKSTVNHIDADPSNNHLSNLEWATESEQAVHRERLKREAKA
jgi:hypothetical protein